MSLFLLHCEKSPYALPNKALFSEDTASVFARIEENNWLRPGSRHQCMSASLDKLPSMSLRTLRQCIPIGSIDFVERVLQLAHNIPHITPIVIPKELLSHPEWLGRRVVFEDSIKKAGEMFERFRTDEIFLKSTSRLKTNFTGVYGKNDTLPKTDDTIFFSEPIDIDSEWRAFVFRGDIRDIRCYSGDSWLLPDRQAVTDMTKAIGDRIPSYTLDVGVTSEGKTVVIEVHNFISCGIYGAYLPLAMYTAAYRYELRAHELPSPTSSTHAGGAENQ